MRTLYALVLSGAVAGLTGCGGTAAAPAGAADKPLTVAEWTNLPVDAKYTAETIERLKKGDDKGVMWSPPAMVSLGRPGDVQAQAARDVFGADPSKLPAYVGLPLQNGRYVVYRVSKVVEAAEPTAEQRKELAAQLNQITAQQQFDAYLQAVKASAGVQIDNARIEKKVQ